MLLYKHLTRSESNGAINETKFRCPPMLRRLPKLRKVREFSFISPLFTEKLEPLSDPSKRYSQELSNSLVSLNVLASLCCLVRHSMLTNHSSSRPSFDAASTFHMVLRST